MKRIFFCIITSFTGILAASAQNEIPADTLKATPQRVASEGIILPEGQPLPDDVKATTAFCWT